MHRGAVLDAFAFVVENGRFRTVSFFAAPTQIWTDFTGAFEIGFG